MADTTSKPVESKPAALDWAKAKAHIELVTKAALENAGKNNHNPYNWLRDNVSELQKKVNDVKQQTQELYNTILALPSKPDTRIK